MIGGLKGLLPCLAALSSHHIGQPDRFLSDSQAYVDRCDINHRFSFPDLFDFSLYRLVSFLIWARHNEIVTQTGRGPRKYFLLRAYLLLWKDRRSIVLLQT